MIRSTLLRMSFHFLLRGNAAGRLRAAGRYAAPVPSLLLLGLIVGLPADPGAVFGPAHLGLSLELAALFGAASLAARRGWRAGAGTIWLLTALLLTILLIRLADLSARAFAGRAFEPGYDLMLLPALAEVMTANLSAPLPGVGLGAALVVAAVAVRFLLGSGLKGLERPAGRRVFAGFLVLALAGQGIALAAGAGWRPLQPSERTVLALGRDLAGRMGEAAALRRQGAEALARDPVGAIPDGRLLAALRGRDVIVVWVESYGLSALTDPRHVQVRERLARMEGELQAAGFHAVSGVLDSPVVGGRSWLAHGTFRAGIRQPQVPVQAMVLASGRSGLVHAFARAGWRTVAAMPGLGSPWPEGLLWGFDQVVRRVDFPYSGPAFGWSAVPDQALLASVEEMGLRGGGRPVYLEVVLTSSHAPWTPNPPWLEVRDRGGMADGSAYAGPVPPPDYGRMAEGYAASLDYSLRAVSDWLVRAVGDGALVIVLGDHPALTWIAEDRGHAVPAHVFSRDRAVLAPFRAWGFQPGVVPEAEPPLFGLEGILERFLDAFSPEGKAA
ncbi:LTA synthase family protein [Indioceanicola profundi]|uniref:LTA synthase family protein n=1 Tax=Indioceanicola profundi TaxID=2220096 RepID=UPI0013C3FFCC|nr:LTA synthase family protein [Indioceanicola profundi]